MSTTLLAVLVLGALCLSAQDYSLAIGESGSHTMLYRYLTAIAERYWHERQQKIAALRTPNQVRAHQQYVRMKVTELMGGFPERTPLHARVTGTLSREGYQIEKLIFESRPNFFVTADVYVPTSGKGPFPAILGAAGHTESGKAFPQYQRTWINLARRGFVVLAFDPVGQGERLEYFDPELGRSRVGAGTLEHTSVGLQCLMTGSNIAQYFVWDEMRGLDYLLTRSDVDAKRIGVAGNSGGGTQSAYMAALDERVAAAAPSCFLTSSPELWAGPGPQDSEQNLAGFIAAGLDISDFVLAFAPRPFDVITATRDFFPITGSRNLFREAQSIYQILHAQEKVGFFEFDATHGWSQPLREASYHWFQRWLNHNPNDADSEPPTDTEPEQDLWATSSGQLQLQKEEFGETVFTMNAKLADQLASSRRELKDEALRTEIRNTLSIASSGPAHALEIRSTGEIRRTGYRIEKIIWSPENGVELPALLFMPNSGAAKRPAVIYLDSRGKHVEAGPGDDLETLVLAGQIVLAPDLRGWGETADEKHVLTPRYSISMRALLVGKTMPGMQVVDVLSAVDLLATHRNVDASRIAVFAKGAAGPVALMAAALEPRIARITVEGAPVSYIDLTKHRLHDEIADMVIPGVLKHFDLPSVAAAIAPRTLWLANPQRLGGIRESLTIVTAAYQSARSAYASYGAAERFRVTTRPEGWSFTKAYADWLAK